MATKQCNKCSKEKELGAFGLQKKGLHGRRSICRDCVSTYNSVYSKERFSSDPIFRQKRIEAAAAWSSANPEKRAEIAKRRNQKEQRDSPEKIKARALVNQRIRFGRMPKASSLACVECGGIAAHYHHYKGYAFENRYDVQPVCSSCHKLLG
jgi:uncharacterized protein YaiL (DUF2058 family)